MRAWIVGMVWLPLVGLAGCEGPTCPPSFAREDGRCVCPLGRVIDAAGTTCVCAGNLVDVGGRCECPTGLVLDAAGTSCGCPDGRVLVGEACVCPSFEEENERGACVCFEGRLRDEAGACVCPEPLVPSTPSGEACVCPPPLVVGESPRECVCPAPFVPAGETCACPEGRVPDEDEGCRCPEGFVADGAGGCACAEGSVVVEGTCVATACALPAADCDRVPGCESELATDETHCGLCGAGCAGTCTGGECDVARETVTVRGEAPEGTQVTLLGSVPSRQTVAGVDGRYTLEVPRTSTRPFLRFEAEGPGPYYPGVVWMNPELPDPTDAYLLDREELVGFATAAGVTQASDRGLLVVVVVLEGGRERVSLSLDRSGAPSATHLGDGTFEPGRGEATAEVLNNAWLNLAPGLVSVETDATCTVRFGAPRIFAGTATLLVLGCS